MRVIVPTVESSTTTSVPTTTMIVHRLDCWLTIFLVLLAIVLAAAYYAYCVYGKSTRQDKETEPLMPVATATPMT